MPWSCRGRHAPDGVPHLLLRPLLRNFQRACGRSCEQRVLKPLFVFPGPAWHWGHQRQCRLGLLLRENSIRCRQNTPMNHTMRAKPSHELPLKACASALAGAKCFCPACGCGYKSVCFSPCLCFPGPAWHWSHRRQCHPCLLLGKDGICCSTKAISSASRLSHCATLQAQRA